MNNIVVMNSDQENTKQSISVPGNFAVCNLADCVKSSSCLRHVAAGLIPPRQMCIVSVNPNFVTHENLVSGTCAAYVNAQRVTLARGFQQALKTVPLGNKKALEAQLRNRFCQAVYYRVRKGTRALTPEEQQFVEQVLVANGAHRPVIFDAYEEDYLWDR